MVKPKHGEEEEPDGLEITSIGSLYSGPWDKKYWSSSRGKDRYPYPVGYQAARAFNGSTDKMEIREGSKGPTFLITSADGHSYSGQTPYIAFEKFQKKYGARIKDLNGKRFSCKLDGVEFFGFKNPFIQKLLRELVANVNGRAEQHLSSSAISDCPSRVNDDSCCQDSHSNPNLLPYLSKEQQITRKRSRRRVIIDAKKHAEANVKIFRPQDQIYVADASHLIEGSQRNHNSGNLLPSLLREGCAKPQAPLLASLNIISSPEGKRAISDNGLPLTSVQVSNNVSKSTDFAEEARMLIDFGKYKPIGANRKFPTDRQYFDRSPELDGKFKELNFSNNPEAKNGDSKSPKDSQDINNVDVCVRDTSYPVKDHTSSSEPSIHDKSFYCTKEESVARDAIISEGPVTGFHSEEVANSNSNASSQRSDFDSVGQEMVKSMMTFLLPQAIPLLKKGSRKNKVSVSPIKVLPPMMHFEKENNEDNRLSPAAILAENKDAEIEQMNYQFKDTSSVLPTKSVAVGNLMDNPYDQHLSNDELSPSPNAEACQANVKKNILMSSPQGQLVDFDKHKGSLDSHLENSNSKDIFCYDEVCTNLENVLQDSDTNLSESLAKCTQEKQCFEKIGNACTSMNENSTDIVLDSDEMDLENPSSCIEGANVLKFRRLMSSSNISPKQNSVMNVAADTGNASTTMSHVSNMVYSRKRVRTVTPIKGKYNGLLSESIIFRNYVDRCHSEKYRTEGNSLASKTRQISSSDDKSCEKDICGSEVRDLGPQGEKSAINPKSLLNNAGFNILEGDAFTFKDTKKLQFPGHFVVQKNNFESHDKNVVHHKSLSSQKHESSSNSSCTSITEQVHKRSGLNSQGIDNINKSVSAFKLVGCYLHPVPVLLLLLRTRGNEINICALCGLPDDEARILFMYKVSSIDPTVGRPVFIGHTSVDIPILNNDSGRQFALEKSGFQLTPDGQCIVLVGSIRTPCCSQGKIPCFCSACTSDCSDENEVKIVKIKLGYVSVVTKLKTVDCMRHILVCEPNYLVAFGKSGRLHIWVMNSTWSAKREEFIVQPDDCLSSPSIVDLKRIPNCAHLVVGWNGFGEFCLWDISKRILLSKFCTPRTSICEFFPVSLFSWQRKGLNFSSSVDAYVEEVMAATSMWFTEQTKNLSVLSLDEKNMAVWLLVRIVPDSDAQHDHISGHFERNSMGLWRLALLVKNMVILGSALDPSAAAIGTSGSHGIIGTFDGMVYSWEMTTGSKLVTMHHFKGGSVSCISTDDSMSAAIAVASTEGQLLVYQHS